MSINRLLEVNRINKIKKKLKNKIHIYIFDISPPVNSASAYSNLLLDESEQARAKQFKFDLHRQRFIAAHTKLREILKKYVLTNPVITRLSNGKPVLRDYPDIHFNLSHSENKAVCAVSWDISLGIDIEYKDPSKNSKNNKINYFNIAERFFAPAEIQDLKLSDCPEELFFKLWTRKEAYLKAIGKGLAQGLDKPVPEDFEIHDFIPAPGYTAALIYPKRDHQQECLFFEY